MVKLPEDRRNEGLFRWVVKNPVGWGLVTAVLIGGWVRVNHANILVSVLLGAIVGLANWFICRPGGPGHRWNASLRRRFPPKD